MPDNERLMRAAQAAFDGCTEVKLSYFVLKKLARTLREADFKVQLSGTLARTGKGRTGGGIGLRERRFLP